MHSAPTYSFLQPGALSALQHATTTNLRGPGYLSHSDIFTPLLIISEHSAAQLVQHRLNMKQFFMTFQTAPTFASIYLDTEALYTAICT